METNRIETERSVQIFESVENSLSQADIDFQLQNTDFAYSSLSVEADKKSTWCAITFPLEKLQHLKEFALINVCVDINHITAIVQAAKELEILELKNIRYCSTTSNLFPVNMEVSAVHVNIQGLFDAIGQAPRLKNIDLSDNYEIFTIPYKNPTLGKPRKNSKADRSYHAEYHEARGHYVESLCNALFKPSREYRLHNCNLGGLLLNKITLLAEKRLFKDVGCSTTIYLQNNTFSFDEVWDLMCGISKTALCVEFDRKILTTLTVDDLWSVVTDKFDASVSFDNI